MNDSGEAPDINLLNQLNAIAGGSSKEDLGNMNTEDMKQFSESVAKAADQINTESEVEVPLESDDNVQLKSSTLSMNEVLRKKKHQ